MTTLLKRNDEVSIEKVIEETGKVTDSWVKLISVVGVPSVIALYLVWQFTSSMEADLKDLNKAMPLHVQATERLNSTNERILGVLQSICVNSAKNNGEREKCFGR